jgi:hypothetical protein
MTTLLIAEHDNLALNGQTAQALTAANALGQPVDILVAGAGCAAVASAAAALGAARVLVADDARYAARSPKPSPRWWSRLRAVTTPSSPPPPAPARTCCRASLHCSTSCRFPTSWRWNRPIPSAGRSMPATPSRS